MKRIPVFATLVVMAAVAIMIYLGIWQLQRAQWKNDLLVEYAAAEGKSVVKWPVRPDPENLPLFRRSSLDCGQVTGWRSSSGRSRNNTAGYAHIATCNLAGDENATAQVVIGWSKSPKSPDWNGGRVEGIIGPDSKHMLRLVSGTPADGFRSNASPSLENIPNNHMAYAWQWFFFAFIAALIYVLALVKRAKEDSG
ncbi:SURF1 family cytochrome oxidase biogenesis protein [Sphingorhabdus sp. Alg239-R122]|uniref:SURF1 family cytochrome oxidase biogenesis protein n=1 Tax=Sphingorhabdus sp. Alg239-R122 TaxID=2305989 RepID=UPI0013D9BB1D|nr:SURF1 family cytochrome oxidase biogenesis protein [Sphingorhabdus sp. Alg239-R122]